MSQKEGDLPRPNQLRLGAIPHPNESIRISSANEEFNGHRLTSKTERGDRKVVTKMKHVAKCHRTAIPPVRAGSQLPSS